MLVASQETFNNIWRRFWLSQLKRGLLLASRGWKPGMLINTLQCPERPHTRTILFKMSTGLRLSNQQAAVATACVTKGCVAMAQVHELVLLPGGARAPLSGSDEPLVGTTHSLSCRLPHTTSLAKLFLVLVPEGTASVPRDLGTAEMCSPHDQMLREKKIEKNRKKNCLGGKY